MSDASTNIVANTKKTEVDKLIELMRAELDRVKADLKDELDKVNADVEKLRALNVSHDGPRGLFSGDRRLEFFAGAGGPSETPAR
jgi:hypothetical protein